MIPKFGIRKFTVEIRCVVYNARALGIYVVICAVYKEIFERCIEKILNFFMQKRSAF